MLERPGNRESSSMFGGAGVVRSKGLAARVVRCSNRWRLGGLHLKEHGQKWSGMPFTGQDVLRLLEWKEDTVQLFIFHAIKRSAGSKTAAAASLWGGGCSSFGSP